MSTDTGRVRATNEDVCLADAQLRFFVVCDGMGGAAGGAVASGLAARTFVAQMRYHQTDNAPERTLLHAVGVANRTVLAHAQAHPHLRGMGTTLTALQIAEAESAVYVVHVGDSRCYRMRAGVLGLLTEDHTHSAEQLRQNAISASKAAASPWRHVLTRVVGTQPEVEPQLFHGPVLPGDVYLLCSDGLTHALADEEIAETLTQPSPIPELARDLVAKANAAGGDDNITVILVHM